MKHLLFFVFFLSITHLGLSQTTHRDNFSKEYWNDYVGVYSSHEGGTNYTLSITWGNRLILTNLKTGKYSVFDNQDTDRFASGDSLTLRFERSDTNTVSSFVINGTESAEADKESINIENITIQSSGAIIAGTLLKPVGDGPYPLLIMNGGASWIIRDTNLDLALQHVSKGRAAFVYDKRGFGESTGEQSVAFQTTADDINNIARHFSFRMDINPSKIGISTYSQSGWYGTLASSQSDHISFQILNVPAATTIERQERQRIKTEMDLDDFSEQEIENALSLFDLMSNFSKTGTKWDEYISLREKYSDKGWINYLFAPTNNKQETWAWGRMNWQYNPLPALLKTKIPTLVILGENDPKVLPDVNRSIFELVFNTVNPPNSQILVIDKMDHSLTITEKAGRNQPSSYTYAQGYFEAKESWLDKIIHSKK